MPPRPSRLLIPEPPLLVLPSLAKEIGLYEAIFVQQLFYHLNSTKFWYDNEPWVKRTIPEWNAEFPFMSESTLKRTISHLREIGLVIATSQYTQNATDRTLYYSLAWAELEKLEVNSHQVKLNFPSGQIDPMDEVKVTQSIIRNDKKKDKRKDKSAGAPPPAAQGGDGDQPVVTMLDVIGGGYER